MGKETVISVNGLGKKYHIGERVKSYRTLGDTVSKFFGNIRKRSEGGNKRGKKDFWALDDISFEVKQGDVVGIIGHNGAGKSTLLKILSRITEPTKGYAEVHGRIGSLLEVGTGFHPELTGRENIYLSGTILGMKKNDIDLRLDEIIAFAGVEEFVDTPIKHYSSGMNLRLGFAVAAHLEPEILLIDEVLAVGDMKFQKKCLNKMEDVATEGRTVLFVSHNMGSIKELCKSGLVLKNGKVDYLGDVAQAIHHYSSNVMEDNLSEIQINSNGFVKLFVNDGDISEPIQNTEPIQVTTEIVLKDDVNFADFHCFLEDVEGTQIIHNREMQFKNLEKGRYRINAQIPPLYLKPGVYTLHFKFVGEVSDSENSKLIRFLSERIMIDITDDTEMFSGKVRALLLPPFEWKFFIQLNDGEKSNHKVID